jgi:hypothetical protein
MVRLVVVWIGVSVLADRQAPPRTRCQQVHLVRLDKHRPDMPLQPERNTREVGEAAGGDAKVTVPIKINGQSTPMTLISVGGKWRIEKFDFPVI